MLLNRNDLEKAHIMYNTPFNKDNTSLDRVSFRQPESGRGGKKLRNKKRKGKK